MEDSPIDYDAMAERLETTEVADGILPHDDYVRLFAIYLHNRELSSSKFLWHRVPDHLKRSADIMRIWLIGKLLWKKQNIDAMKLVDYNWSEQLKPIISFMKESMQKETLEIISEGFSVISINSFQISMGTDRDGAVKIAQQQMGWECDERFIYPTSAEKNVMSPKTFDILERLTHLELLSSNIEESENSENNPLPNV